MAEKLKPALELETRGRSIMAYPDDKTVADGPIMRSGGDLDFTCSACDGLLLIGLGKGQLSNAFLLCSCGQYNRSPW